MMDLEYTKNDAGVFVPNNELKVGGVFHWEHRRGDRVLDSGEDRNLVVNEGLNSLLSIMFNGGSQITTWYLGVFEGNYTPLATVTAATITSASTECTAYDSATRPEYTEAAPSSQSITNSASRASFVFNATKTVYGAFLVSTSTKSGTTGTLFSAARFGTAKAVVTDDELLLTYTFTASSV